MARMRNGYRYAIFTLLNLQLTSCGFLIESISSRSQNDTARLLVITQQPDSQTLLRSATIKFTANTLVGDNVYCQLNQQAPSLCDSKVDFNGLLPGNHEFKVYVQDASNQQVELKKSNWEVLSTLDLSSTNDWIFSGESATFTGIGGATPYSYSTMDPGVAGTSTGLFTAAFSNGTSTITVTDAESATKTKSISVKGFVTKDTSLVTPSSEGLGDFAISSSNGYMFTAGSSVKMSGSSWLVRKSTDNGVTWTTVDNFGPASLTDYYPKSIAIDTVASIVYVAGNSNKPSTGTNLWIVRKSHDWGSTWTTIDNYGGENNGGFPNASANSVAVDSTGAVFVIGSGKSPGSSQSALTIRKSTDAGATWSLFQYSRVPNWGFNTGVAIGFSTAGDVIVTGRGMDSNLANGAFCNMCYNWVTFRSTDNGVSWTLVDVFNVETTGIHFFGGPMYLATGPSNTVYVSGTDTGATMGIRKSTDGGATWSTVTITAPIGIRVVHSNGDVFGSEPSLLGAVNTWDTRKSVDGGLNWTQLENFTTVTGASTNLIRKMLISGSKIWVAGVRTRSDRGTEWAVRNALLSSPTFSDFASISATAECNGGFYSVTAGSLANEYYAMLSCRNNDFRYNLMRTLDGGVTWSLVSTFGVPLMYEATPRGLGIMSDGRVIVASTDYRNDSNYIANHWTIRRSDAAKTTWTVLQDEMHASGYSKNANSVLVHPNDNLTVAGGESLSSTSYRWLVRKSSNYGTSWTDHDTYQLSAGKYAVANKVARNTAGDIFVVGSAYSATNEGHWIVRKGTFAGAFATSDDFNLAAGKTSSAQDLVIDSSNNIFVVGTGADASFLDHLIIRTSTDGGSSWSTVTDYQFSATTKSTGASITKNSNGDLFVAGAVTLANNSRQSIILMKKSGASGFTLIDSQQFYPTYSTDINALVSFGTKIFSLGFALDGSRYHPLMRILDY